MTTQPETIQRMLRPIIEQARGRGMWLRCPYQDLWFSPDELEAKNAEGKFLWGPVNWELRDPEEHIQQLEQKIERAEDELTTFRRRVAQNKRLLPNDKISTRDHQGGFIDGKGDLVVAGDRVEYRFDNHRTGVLDEALQDGDAFVTWDDDGSKETVKWCHLAKIVGTE